MFSKKGVCTAAVLAILSCLSYVAAAEELAQVELDGEKVVLLGDKLKNGFVRNFILRVERDTAPYTLIPDLPGGYWPELKLVELRKGEKQILFSTRQGGQNATSEFRIFGKKKGKVEEIFSATESSGVISQLSLADKKMKVQLLDGTKQTIPVKDELWDKLHDALERNYPPYFESFYSLMALDGDKDGVQELYASQRMELAGQELGYIAVRMDLQKDDSWRMSHYVLQLPTVTKDTENINAGVTVAAYELHPQKIFVEQSQGAVPRFYYKNPKVMEKVNEVIDVYSRPNLQKMFDEHAVMGFEIVISYENILSLRFIGGKDKYNTFVHIDPATGKTMGLDAMFDIGDDFLKTMTVLSPSKHKYVKKDLKNWFMKGTKLSIILDEKGKQRAEQFALSAFEAFLMKDNKILQKKDE